ncbi:MAG: serine/threonine protein kinase [Deltaproteobacteria bacterium]|nr:serine/threonine protein kinase [Deltaproteobacteria bacterium]
MERFGDWQLDALIAVGGLGEVWQATNGDRTRALKRLHTHLSRNEEGRAQFAVEQQLATTLPRHPNVVHADEIGEVEGRPYIALALAPGQDLRRLLTPEAVLPRARVIAILTQACDAVAHLHAHGWVHGDVNPGNLVVADSDQTTLIDLGVSRAVGEAGMVRGTHAYMAPEQVRGEPWTRATDVFALGVVLWELVAGARLFHRGPSWLSMAAVVEATAPALSDPALDVIVQAALAKDPADRIPTATELLDRLRG